MHINTKIPDFAADIEALWQEWINVTANTTEKQELQDALIQAQEEAQHDCDQLIELIDKGSQ